MDVIDRVALQSLAKVRQAPAVTMYMPLYRASVERRQNIVRYHNMVRNAYQLVIDHGATVEQANELLAKARNLEDDDAFWRTSADGVAVFATVDHLWTFRLPVYFTEAVHVGETFQVMQLLHAAAVADPILVLTLSENHACLHRVDGQGVHVVDVPDMPAGLDAVVPERSHEQQVQVRSTVHQRMRKHGAVFHGQGGATEHAKAELQAYCRAIDETLRPLLAAETAPLVLAATEPLASMYSQIGSYAHRCKEFIRGNPDRWTDHELLARVRQWGGARQAVEDARVLNDATELGGKASSDVDRLTAAAQQGQIDLLFVADDVPVPSDAPEVIEFVVRETLAHQGEARIVGRELLPPGAAMAARFRYGEPWKS